MTVSVLRSSRIGHELTTMTELKQASSRMPNVERAIADYRRLAPVYDRETRWIDAARGAAIARLAPRSGETVADIACGTGFALPAISTAVGSEGKVIGVDASAAMLAVARSRTSGLANVELVESAARTARLSVAPDALLFSFAHDVLQCRAALHNILAQAKVGARVVAVGSKLFPWCLAPRNLWFVTGERGYVTT